MRAKAEKSFEEANYQLQVRWPLSASLSALGSSSPAAGASAAGKLDKPVTTPGSTAPPTPLCGGAPCDPQRPVTVIVSPVEPVTVTPGAGQMTVRWNAAGKSGISGYSVAANPRPVKNKSSTRGSCTTNGWNQTTCVIKGLTTGATYDIVVTATGPAGPLRPSAPVSAVVR